MSEDKGKRTVNSFEWLLTIGINFIFFVLWLVSQLALDRIMNRFATSAFDRSNLELFQLIFGVTTLLPILAYALADLTKIFLQFRRKPEQEASSTGSGMGKRRRDYRLPLDHAMVTTFSLYAQRLLQFVVIASLNLVAFMFYIPLYEILLALLVTVILLASLWLIFRLRRGRKRIEPSQVELTSDHSVQASDHTVQAGVVMPQPADSQDNRITMLMDTVARLEQELAMVKQHQDNQESTLTGLANNVTDLELASAPAAAAESIQVTEQSEGEETAVTTSLHQNGHTPGLEDLADTVADIEQYLATAKQHQDNQDDTLADLADIVADIEHYLAPTIGDIKQRLNASQQHQQVQDRTFSDIEKILNSSKQQQDSQNDILVALTDAVADIELDLGKSPLTRSAIIAKSRLDSLKRRLVPDVAKAPPAGET